MLLRLRVVHPAIAVAGAIYLIVLSWRVLRRTETEETKAAGRRVFSLTILQVAAGAVNLGLLAPLPMQMSHLLIADVLWIAVVLMVTEVTATESIRHGAEAAAGGGDMELAIGLERRPTERGSSARHSSAS
ncbi:MAG: COX15/CtaA family protein [Acidobacteriaceae bacterium]|nr:COX15/CtaA family protein [Acidobacteriaceae bacterium]